jgi:molybdopterin molybdotransferase
MKEALISTDRAWALIARHARERGRISGQALPKAVRAADPYPRFDNCALDGYALRAADLASASRERPVWLRVVADQFAGSRRQARLKKGEAVQVATGAPLPPGADSVVQYELTRREGKQVSFIRAPRRGSNVRRQGEDFRRGETLAQAGDALSPALHGLLAAAGQAQPLLRVRALVSGDELATGAATGGQIYDANGPLLQGLLAAAGIAAPAPAYVPDRLAPALKLLRGALDADLVLLAGGMSVGKRDLLKPALERLGVQRLFWGVAQKPGKPLYLGKKGKTLVVGLPGNPAAVFTCFHAYVLPLLRGLAGLKAAPRWSQAALAEALEAPGSKALFLKAHVDARGRLRVLGGQGSHQLRSLAEGNALLYLPAGTRPLKRGAAVRFLSLKDGRP